MKHKITLSRSGMAGNAEGENEYAIVYTVSKYHSATYWQPAEGGEIEILSIKCDGRELTGRECDEAVDWILDCHDDELRDHAEAAEDAAREQAAEMRREQS